MGIACDLGYPCAKFRLPRLFGFRVRADVRDIRQTAGRGHNKQLRASERLASIYSYHKPQQYRNRQIYVETTTPDISR